MQSPANIYLSPVLHGPERDSQQVGRSESSSPVAQLVSGVFLGVSADEESFNELQEKPKKAFTMACGNPMCVNLTHIALDE